MLKMERTCSSLKCDVLHEGEFIGHMEGVNLTQWFLKDRYSIKGSFSKFSTENPDYVRPGIVVDIIFPDKKIIARDARIEWINSFGTNGTFQAKNTESCDI